MDVVSAECPVSPDMVSYIWPSLLAHSRHQFIQELEFSVVDFASWLIFTVLLSHISYLSPLTNIIFVSLEEININSCKAFSVLTKRPPCWCSVSKNRVATSFELVPWLSKGKTMLTADYNNYFVTLFDCQICSLHLTTVYSGRIEWLKYICSWSKT